jgi:NAD(P)-dependent dehydrogenase (short-subunit alcohol dehydrogenase family)
MTVPLPQPLRRRGCSSWTAILHHSETVAFVVLAAQLAFYAILFGCLWRPSTFSGYVLFALMVNMSYRSQRFLACGFGRIALVSKQARDDLPGKLAIVTGGNSGIGFETARALLEQGVNVVLGCRDEARGHAAAQLLRAAVPRTRAQLTVLKIDLEKQASVRAFVKSLPYTTVDILINNAGYPGEYGHHITEDGMERVVAVNYLSQFLLTDLLLPRLKRGYDGHGGRIVNVSASAHVFMPALDPSKSPHSVVSALEASASKPGKYYGLAKLCMVMHAEYLARRYGFKAYSAHPGAVLTAFYDRHWPVKYFLFALNVLVLKSPWEGAQTTLQCVFGPAAEPTREACVANTSNFLVRGGYYSDCRLADNCRHAKTVDTEELDHMINWSRSACV